MLPAENFEEDWTNAGGEPTDNPVNAFAGNNNPMVFNGIRIGQAIFYLKNQYPTVLEERRKVHFGNLEQGDEAIEEFYDKLKHYGSLLNFGNEIVEHHFFKGLSPENQLEVERIGGDKSIEELVKSLKRVEQRKAEMKLGLTKRMKSADTYQNQPQVQPQLVSNSSEVSNYRPSSGYSSEEVNRMIKSATEKITQDFQAQFQALQAKIPTDLISEIEKIPVHSDDYWKNKMDQLRKRSEKSNAKFNELQAQIAEDNKRADNVDKMATRIAERIEQRKLDKEISTSFPELFGNLNIKDDPMDTSNLIREIATDDDEYTLQLVRKKK